MPTPYEIEMCKRILKDIEPHIPLRHYVKPVQRIIERKGLEVPNKFKIQNVRHGRVYDLDIVLALSEISKPRDEKGERVPRKKYKIDEK
ncbi:hypothetical protein PZB74_02135 [Porifericola rhodea]|uniref:hypothetical protein n=1 Tax=Porifericola rhodea TaxID=930972 RepID=UPI0026661455|nr:hypothetical protein [Porifericola rhodea]WKN32152.1 hypothetical protein PZB74_02135 [Porifericola rhodea]